MIRKNILESSNDKESKSDKPVSVVVVYCPSIIQLKKKRVDS